MKTDYSQADAPTPALAYLDRVPLDRAVELYRSKAIPKPAFLQYLHLWQTSAPRFGIRACDCEPCRIKYPSGPLDGYVAIWFE